MRLDNIMVNTSNSTHVMLYTDIYCPVCGNQTVWNFQEQTVHCICARCTNSFQIRPNTRSLERDADIANAIYNYFLASDDNRIEDDQNAPEIGFDS